MNEEKTCSYYTLVESDELIEILQMRLDKVGEIAQREFNFIDSVRDTLPWSYNNAKLIKDHVEDLLESVYRVRDAVNEIYEKIERTEKKEDECTLTTD